MRLVPIDCAADTFIAEDIYDLSGRVLLKKDTRMTETYGIRMKNAGYASVYIKDQYSLFDVQALIPSELKNFMVQSIKSLHQIIRHPQSRGLKIHNLIDDIFKLGQDIQYELNARRSTTIDYIDIKSSLTYTYEHCISVAVLSFILSKTLGFAPQDMHHVFTGALFHDIGMAFIDETVFMKNGKLNMEEFVKIKSHPELGYNFVKNLPQFNAYAKVVTLQHHEKIDGNGYPNMLEESAIHPYAKLVAICDIYDAMTSDRPYSKAVEPLVAINHINSAAGKTLDETMACHFIKKLVPYPQGTLVALSSGQKVVILKNDPEFPLTPTVQVIDPHRKMLTSEHISLSAFTDLKIEHVLYKLK